MPQKDNKDMTLEEIRQMFAGMLGGLVGGWACISYILSHPYLDSGDQVKLLVGAAIIGGAITGGAVEQALEHPIATKEKIQNLIRDSIASGSQKIRCAIEQATNYTSKNSAVSTNGLFSQVITQEQAVAKAKKEISRKFLGNGEVTSVGSRANETGERYVAVGYLSEITDEIPSSYPIRCEKTGKEILVPVIKMIAGQAIAQTASCSKS